MRLKFVFAVLVVISLLSAVFYVRHSAASLDDDYTTYYVEAGDTLWDIAVRFAPRSMDLRDYIFRVRHINELSSATIHPGQELRLPSFR